MSRKCKGDWLSGMKHCLENNMHFAMVTVIRTKGSTPRRAGAKMIVSNDALWGTIGGGSVENELIVKANECLGKTDVLKKEYLYNTEEELSLACGGQAEYIIESF